MKKTIFILLLLLSSSTKSYFNWEPAINLLDKKLEIGDIIIRKKGKKPIEWFGHVAIIVDNNKVVEFPNYKSGYNRVSLNIWIEDSRDVILLRSKEKFNEKFILKEILKHQYKSYGILHKKKSSDKFYCSQFVWYIYYKIFDESLITNSYNFILPYDFLYSEALIQI